MHLKRDELNADGGMRDIIVPMLAGCAAYALFRMAQTVLLAGVFAHPGMTAAHRVTLSALDGLLMAATTPVAVMASRSFPVSIRTPFNVAVHFAIGALLAAVTTAVMRISGEWMTGVAVQASFGEYYLISVTGGLAAYAVVVAVAHAILAARRAHAEQLRASRLDGQLSTARLETLKAQLQPHFLFNTLHTISELVHIDPAAADAMITALGQLLRRTLDASMLHDVTVDDELRYIGAYLDIHRVRHRERLQVVFDVDPAVRLARIPPLILQPLVENALRHGIAASPDGGTITVGAHRADGKLRLTVSDDGAGFDGIPAEGVGLSNTRRRLAELFGDASIFTLHGRVPRGTQASVMIPMRATPVAAPTPGLPGPL